MVARVNIKEAEKLLKVMGNHIVLEWYGTKWLALSVQRAWLCGRQLCGYRAKPVRACQRCEAAVWWLDRQQVVSDVLSQS